MILKELKIYTFIGEATNCYVIFDEQSKEIMCIDPAGDVDKIENLIKNVFKGKLKYIYLRPYIRCNRITKKMWRKNFNP